MRRLVFLFALFMSVPFVVSADNSQNQKNKPKQVASSKVEDVRPAFIKNGSLYCITLKKVMNYDSYMKNDFPKLAQGLLDDSDCFIKRRESRVLLLSASEGYSQLRDKHSFTIWTKSDNVILNKGK